MSFCFVVLFFKKHSHTTLTALQLLLISIHNIIIFIIINIPSSHHSCIKPNTPFWDLSTLLSLSSCSTRDVFIADTSGTMLTWLAFLIASSALVVAISQSPSHADRTSQAYKRMHLHCLSLTSQQQKRIADENIQKQLHRKRRKKQLNKRKNDEHRSAAAIHVNSAKRGLLSIADQMKVLAQPLVATQASKHGGIENSADKPKANNKDFWMKRNTPTWNCPLEGKLRSSIASRTHTHNAMWHICTIL